MSLDSFLHGIEVVEIDTGVRPIATARSSIIGLIGTAPQSQTAAAAVLSTGAAADGTGIDWTAVTAGAAGNDLQVHLVRPAAINSDLAVSVSGTRITVSLETDGGGTAVSTADDVVTAVNAHAAASALVTAAEAAGNASPADPVAPQTKPANLTGGQDDAFPLNTPVLVTRRTEAAPLGASGTLPEALDGIYDQAGAWVVVVRVAPGNSDPEFITNITGNGALGTGVHAFTGAESRTGVVPRILVAPGASTIAVIGELVSIAERLRAIVVADGPNTTDQDAIDFRANFGSDRVYIVDPKVRYWDTAVNAESSQWASPRVAGLIAKSDSERGFWWSPSNRELLGITGTARAIDFEVWDRDSRANLLNENEVATIVRKDGWRLWGNRSTAADPQWAFLSVRRTADMIHESLVRSHLWAVDRNITRTYLEDVRDGVNAYLAHLVKVGAIIGGTCWLDEELNTPQSIAQGKVYFDFDFTPPYPAEHITFRSHLVNDYLVEILPR